MFDLETEQVIRLPERPSDREYPVLRMIDRGKTSRTHCKNLLEKMTRKTNAEPANYVIEDNLVPPTD